jgi:hypothetical protein
VSCCGGAVELKGGDGEEAKDGDALRCRTRWRPWNRHARITAAASSDAAATVANAVAPVGAPSVHWRGSAPRVYYCGGAEEFKGGDGEE